MLLLMLLLLLFFSTRLVSCGMDAPTLHDLATYSMLLLPRFSEPGEQVVSPAPDVTCVRRSHDDEFLILGTDGIWDVMDNQVWCCQQIPFWGKRFISFSLRNSCIGGRDHGIATYRVCRGTDFRTMRNSVTNNDAQIIIVHLSSLST